MKKFEMYANHAKANLIISDMEKTIRQMISERSEELRNAADLHPTRVAEILLELSSLLASLGAHIAEKKYIYNVLLQSKLEELGVAAKAKIKAQASNEFRELLEAEAQKEALIEEIRSAKYFLRAHEQEWRVTK